MGGSQQLTKNSPIFANFLLVCFQLISYLLQLEFSPTRRNNFKKNHLGAPSQNLLSFQNLFQLLFYLENWSCAPGGLQGAPWSWILCFWAFFDRKKFGLFLEDLIFNPYMLFQHILSLRESLRPLTKLSKGTSTFSIAWTILAHSDFENGSRLLYERRK